MVEVLAGVSSSLVEGLLIVYGIGFFLFVFSKIMKFYKNLDNFQFITLFTSMGILAGVFSIFVIPGESILDFLLVSASPYLFVLFTMIVLGVLVLSGVVLFMVSALIIVLIFGGNIKFLN